MAEYSIRTTSQLYWGKYPFKVETVCPAIEWEAWVNAKNGNDWKFAIEEQRKYQRCVDIFTRKCIKHAPLDRTVWKLNATPKALHVFFQNEADFDYFVDKNKDRIHCIYRPASQGDIVVLGDKKNEIRTKLYLNSYRYCIYFKHLKESKNAEIDRWVEEVFEENTTRCAYKKSARRRFYVNGEQDILMTQIAFSKEISRITTAILRSEINESTIGKKTD